MDEYFTHAQEDLRVHRLSRILAKKAKDAAHFS
jgi:hypothetical protein